MTNSAQDDKYHWFTTFDRKYLKPFFRAKQSYTPVADHPENGHGVAEEDEETLEMDDMPVTRLRSDLGE